MKNILLATTALVFTAGAAAAELSFSGAADFGATYTETNTINKTLTDADVTLSATGSAATDGGLSLSTTVVLYDGGTSAGAAAANDTFSTTISNDVFSVSLGSVSEADEVNGIGDIGYNGIGVDNTAEIYGGDTTNGSASNLYAKFSLGTVTVAASTNTATASGTTSYATNRYSATTTVSGVTVGLGYADVDAATTATKGSITSYGLSGAIAGFNVKVGGATWNPDSGTTMKSEGVYVSYALNDATTLAAAWGDNNGSGTQDAYGVSAAYALGGGATVSVATGDIKGVTVSEVGVSFSF